MDLGFYMKYYNELSLTNITFVRILFALLVQILFFVELVIYFKKKKPNIKTYLRSRETMMDKPRRVLVKTLWVLIMIMVFLGGFYFTCFFALLFIFTFIDSA